MVIGENQKLQVLFSLLIYISARLVLNTQDPVQDNKELIELQEVLERFNREVKEVNKSLGEFEQIKRFRLVTKNGLLRPENYLQP